MKIHCCVLFRLSYSIAVSLLGVACSGGFSTPNGQSGIPARPDHLGRETVEFHLKVPVRWELPNGLVVLYKYDEEVPLIRGQLYIPGGSLFDPPELVGLASFVGSQLREGGVPGLPPDELDRLLDSRGAEIESGYSEENGKVAFSCLAEDFQEILRIFSLVVREPEFDPSRLKLAKDLAADAIRRRRDSPEKIGAMALEQLVYGKDSPYARVASFASIERIQRQDLREFHKRFVRPNGAVLAIVGAVPERDVREAVEREFSSWVSRNDPLPPLPAVTHQAAPGIYVLKRDLVQATVFMGHLGPRRLSPEMYAVALHNRMFSGGGFESVLFSEVRSKLGLAYMIDGGIMPGPVAGLFEIALATRNEQVIRSIKKVLELIQQTTEEPPDESALAEAKLAIERQFVFNFAETLTAVGRAALLEVLNYPRDYDETYIPRIEATTGAEVLAAAKKLIWPSRMVVVIVGGVAPEEVANAFRGEFSVYRLGFDTEPWVDGQVF